MRGSVIACPQLVVRTKSSGSSLDALSAGPRFLVVSFRPINSSATGPKFNSYCSKLLNAKLSAERQRSERSKQLMWLPSVCFLGSHELPKRCSRNPGPCVFLAVLFV